MIGLLTNAISILLFIPFFIAAQTKKYLTEKPGKWSLSNNFQKKGAAFDVYIKNVSGIGEWFHKKLPLLANPKGFDLPATIFGSYDESYKKRNCNYGIRSQLNYEFQLFYTEKGKEYKWTIEPPHWEFEINNTEQGHGANFCNYEAYKVQVDNSAWESPLEKAIANLCDLFAIFPFEKEISPGVHLYGDGKLIIFNPDRPAFWIPVTVKEVLEMKLAFFSIRTEDKQFIYPYIKKVFENMSQQELNAPAYDGGDDAVVRVNGKKDGLQIMRFNRDYWDRSLPPSAIQFITMWYQPQEEAVMKEFISNNNGRPDYSRLVMHELPLTELGGLIQKK
jgi:hypothetical protein